MHKLLELTKRRRLLWVNSYANDMTVNNDVSKDSPISYKTLLSFVGYISTGIVYTSFQ